VFRLPPGEHLVGRDASAEIRLTDSGVSRRHAKIVFSSDGLIVIADLESTNGVFVNDARVELAALREGYRIRIGAHAELELQAIAQADAPAWSLTPRQLEIARLAAEGLSNAEIGEALGIQRRTVATHLEQVYRRLGLRSRAELGRILAAAGL
jgi:DNA-binding CsgD family transcriptional regulator